jgi:hypothetical protein
MIKQNKIIKCDKNFGLNISEIKVKNYLKDNPNFVDGYIYVDCPDVSDLFIVEKSKIRGCTDAEWGEYFRTYLYPVN